MENYTGMRPLLLSDTYTDYKFFINSLPEISLETPAINFYDVTEGTTIFRAVRFHVRTIRPVKFKITKIPAGNFSITSMGSEFTAYPDLSTQVISQLIWVQFCAAGNNSIQHACMQVEAFTFDENKVFTDIESSYSAAALCKYNINLYARKIPSLAI